MIFNKTQLKEMLDYQFNLNTNTNGIFWINGITKDNRNINWQRTIYMEVSELIDSYPWKHWKYLNSNVDNINVKIELIDIWHFLMSALIELGFKEYEIQAQEVDKSFKLFLLSDEEILSIWKSKILNEITEFLFETYNSIFIKNKKEVKSFTNNEEAISTYENLLLNSILSIKSEDYASKKSLLISSYIEFIQIIIANKIENIFLLYKGKLILNKFRQNNGYKDNTYKKIWFYNNKEVEDNVVMFDLIFNKKIDYISLEENLKEIYSKKNA
jgi:hypothetical protein